MTSKVTTDSYGTGAPSDPWILQTPPLTFAFTMHRDKKVRNSSSFAKRKSLLPSMVNSKRPGHSTHPLGLVAI